MSSSIAYHATGIVQAGLFCLSITALYVQLKLIRQRRTGVVQTPAGELPTYNLSIFAVLGGYLAFFSFLSLSTVTEPFAYYIFLSRLPACVLAILILREFARDSRLRMRWFLFTALLVVSVAFLTCLILVPEWGKAHRDWIQLFVVAAGAVLVSGQADQLRLLLTNKKVGALSLKARFLNLMKDLSTVAFSLALGAHQSWSLIVVAGCNAAITAVVLYVGGKLDSKLPPARA